MSDKIVTVSNLEQFLNNINIRTPGSGGKRLLWSSLTGVACTSAVSITVGNILTGLVVDRFIVVEYGFEDIPGRVKRFRTDPICFPSSNYVHSESFNLQLEGISYDLTASVTVRMNILGTAIHFSAYARNESSGVSADNAYVYAVYEDDSAVMYSDLYVGETAEVNEFYQPETDNSLEDNVATLEDNVATLEYNVATLEDNVAMHNKRITNLEQGLPSEQFMTDSTVAHVKDVPVNALPFAEVSKVGGMTRKCTNLWDEQWEVGQIDVNSGGLMSGTTRIRSKNYIPLDGETTYCFSYDNNSNAFCCYDENYAFLGTKYQWSKTFTTLPNTRYVRFMLHPDYGATYKNDIMLNEGSTALLYEPYFEGLRDAKTTEMKSVGVNLIPFPYVEDTKTNNGVAFTVNGDGTITASGTAVDYNAILRLANNISLPAGTYRVTCTDTPKSGAVFAVMKNGVWHSETNNTMELLVESGDVLTIYLQFVVGISVSNFTFKPMLNKGSTALPYAPYMESTLPVPEAVQALDGYGWGMNADCYNYIDWEKKQFVKRVEKVDLSTLTFKLYINKNERSLWSANLTSVSNIGMCDKYRFTPITDTELVEELTIQNRGNTIYICDSSISSAEEIAGTFVYALNNPIVTDISDLLPDDNFIEVEGNGSITAVNEYGYDVPSEIEYQLEV